MAFGNQAQEAFLDGHVRAFEHFGGVPGRIRYDNLKPAVVRVLRGRDRAESERFIALRSPLRVRLVLLPARRRRARTRRAAWRARSAGSAAATSSRSRRSRRWPSSTS